MRFHMHTPHVSNLATHQGHWKLRWPSWRCTPTLLQLPRRLRGVALSLAAIAACLVPATAEAGSAGLQWSSCSSGSRSFQARIYWNSSGYEYKMEFRSPSARVRMVDLVGRTGVWGMQRIETLGAFNRSTSYSSRPLWAGWPWGWHRHWSGNYWLYESAIDVYVDDGNWYRDCRINFYESSDRF